VASMKLSLASRVQIGVIPRPQTLGPAWAAILRSLFIIREPSFTSAQSLAQLSDLWLVRPILAQPCVKPDKGRPETIQTRPPGNNIYLMRRCASCTHISSLRVVNCQLKKIMRCHPIRLSHIFGYSRKPGC
jgi:hypothetical protein